MFPGMMRVAFGQWPMDGCWRERQSFAMTADSRR
jgi:hypothetical protein